MIFQKTPPEELNCPTEEDLKKADEGIDILLLSQGHLATGDSYYAYVIVKPSKLKALKEAEERGSYMLSDYGEIVKHGNTFEPPEEVKREMKEKYDADYDFESQFKSMSDELLNKQEKEKKLDAMLLDKVAKMKKDNKS